MFPNIGNFSDWLPDHRYYDETAIPTSLNNWKTAADEVGKMIDQAFLDGKIK
jgi:hypothetical protein